MEAKMRRQAILLAGLLCVLAVALWWNLSSSPVPAGGTQVSARRPGATAPARDTPVETVRLDALAAPRPEPGDQRRDPFRFRAGRVQTDTPPEVSQPAMQSTEEAGGGEPIQIGPPPIPLRFIGVLRVAEGQQLTAVLSDGNGVYRGTEGDIIEGRYRIVRVSLDSVELAHLDGRGHQVIRMSGS
jgi:hypothetical protein